MTAPKKRSSPRSRFGVLPQLVVIALVLGLASAMAIQPTRQLLDQRDRISNMSDDLSDVERTNRQLDRRIKRLNDPDYIEREAREAGLVRPGETTYVVMPPSRKSAPKKKGRESPTPTPEPTFVESLLDFIGLG